MPPKVAATFRTHLRLRFHDHIAVAINANAHKTAKTVSEIMISFVSDRSPHREPIQNPKLTRNTQVLADAIAILAYSTESYLR